MVSKVCPRLDILTGYHQIFFALFPQGFLQVSCLHWKEAEKKHKNCKYDPEDDDDGGGGGGVDDKDNKVDRKTTL